MRATTSFPATTVLTYSVQWIFSASIVAAVFALAVGIAVAGFEASYRQRIYPGVSAWGVSLGGMTRPQASEALTRAFTYPQTGQIVLRDTGDGGQTWTLTPKELGVAFNIEATVENAYSLGRSGDIFHDLDEQFDSWYGGQAISPIVVHDYARAESYLRDIAAQIDTPSVEASLSVLNGQVTVTPAVHGRYLDIPATIQALQNPISNLSGAEIELVIAEQPPAVLDATVQGEIARRILSAPLQLVIAEPLANDPAAGFTLDATTLQSMLVFQRIEDGPNSAHYEVGLNPAALSAFLEPLAPSLYHEAQNPRFIFNDDTHQLDLHRPGASGRTLDVQASVEAINDRVVQGEHTVPLVFNITQPAVADTATGADLGITGLITAQSTYFAGSSRERINNIQRGGEQFLGILIAPGEVFSFNHYLGDISLDTGFTEALIIYAGRTIKGVGGGICQVSTTAFRAAFFGGFPIVERHSHAYRVNWYEQGFGPGLDATIFSPVADFKFQNDMDTWLLMEAYVYTGQIEFKLYGQPDGRNVEVRQPQISNLVQPEPDLYEEDPSVAPGQNQQVEWAAIGSDVSVIRIVTNAAGEVMYEDNIRTHYLPWRAIYKVHPGEVPGATPPPPPPEDGS